MKSKLRVRDIVAAGVHVVQEIVRQIMEDVSADPETALEERPSPRKKRALRVDLNAEDTFKRLLRKYKGRKFQGIKVHGEECLRDQNLDLSKEKQIVALVDAVDGTDLVEREMWNWCVALAFYNPAKPPGKRIAACFVGIPGCHSPADVYFATSEKPGAFVRRKSETVEVAGPTKVKSLESASICFYGQKVSNFLSVAKGSIPDNLAALAARIGKKLDIRIYNIGGIPMLMKLADHRVRNARGVDAVFELKGQKPHDCVPGLFIAKKAGATIRDLDGNEFTYSQMEELLMQPAKTSKSYVATSTRRLSDALLALMKSP